MVNLNGILFAKHLEEDEEVQMIAHRHWLLGLKYLFWPTVTFIVLWVFLYYAPFTSVFYGVAFFSVVSLVWLMRNFFDHYLDAWIITDMGVIDVEWHGWFHRQSTRVLYSDIQGVSYEIQGVCGTLFRYGEVSIEKISSGNVISMDDVPNPREVESAILKSMETYLHGKNLKDSKHVQELLAEMVAREVQIQDFDEEEEVDDSDEEET